jgi:hypothetical protein
MLEIDVVVKESFDEIGNKFVTTNSVKVQLEHSLVSVSKWESVWEEPFLSKKDKTREQTLSYIELMLIDNEIAPEVFQKLLENHLTQIEAYVAASMTATTIPVDPNAAPSKEIITSELIYYWMVTMNIPVEFEHWHLKRLMTLIRVINHKNTPAKKMSARERRELNRSRQAKYNTKG